MISPDPVFVEQTLPEPKQVLPLRRGPSLLQQLFQCVAVAALALASYFAISHYFVTTVEVVGSSMVPTLKNSEHYLLNLWVYRFHPPKRGDVIVLRDPGAGCFAVKRVIGVSGDSIYLKRGHVFLNGTELKEPYLRAGTPTFAFGAKPDQMIMCGKDQFYVLGDNRMNSADSRAYGPVPRVNVLGMVVR
ncbi:MAG TPA: signal peptidase I [Candidatus Dormibacteraeota bacterium]|nr:signal peptidase I [Candidatus Dormibacteraeota bacterium]